MPRPPLHPTFDWPSLFASGLTWEAWLAAAESPERRDTMARSRAAQGMDAATRAFPAGLPRPVRVLAIAEDWCGDVVRHAPVLQAIADATPGLEVRFVRRDQHPDLFVRFLTNGGEAIPKFIFLSEGWVECGNWGPMPEACRERIARGKACGDVAAARKQVAALYEADPEKAEVVKELLHLLDIASCKAP